MEFYGQCQQQHNEFVCKPISINLNLLFRLILAMFRIKLPWYFAILSVDCSNTESTYNVGGNMITLDQ
jgi:hypothetical protein